MTSKQYSEMVKILKAAGRQDLVNATQDTTGYITQKTRDQLKLQERDQVRLQFIIDYIHGHGYEGFQLLLKKTPWTVYRHEGDRSGMGFDRRTVDWMMKNHEKVTHVRLYTRRKGRP